MAGKTKVNLEFAMSDNTKQTVSFEVPNGVDGKDGKFDESGGTISGDVIFSGDVTFSKDAIKSTKGTHTLRPKSGTLMHSGDFGIGTVAPRFTNDRLTNVQSTSFFSQTGGSENNLFKCLGCGIHLVYNAKIKAGLFVDAVTGVTYSYYSDVSISDDDIKVREIYSEANTTTDPQGFIKKASPIIDIHPDGTFTTNDESEGATVTRVAHGEYLIEGVLGFNSDAGWGGVDGGIEIPLDVNKQPLVWVNYEVNKDGSILVKTYHRTHPNAPEFANNDIDGVNDGDPIDIPDGRFISVRVQMPEQSIYNMKMREMEDAQKAEEVSNG